MILYTGVSCRELGLYAKDAPTTNTQLKSSNDVMDMLVIKKKHSKL